MTVVMAVVGTMLVLSRSGYLQAIDNFISDARFRNAERAASGDIVYLAIDKKSLDAIHAWPWSRDIHGRIIDALVASDVREIFLDIDLSAPSEPEADAALAMALDRAGGGVLLPAFIQAASVDAVQDELGANLPLPLFRERSWLASVNVVTDAYGVVRSYPFGLTIDTEEIPSIAAMLSGVFGTTGTDFAINYSISPRTVPTYSAIDLLDGKIDRASLKDKSIVLGAHAIELRDNFSVPVHGILSGSMVQILAAETLQQHVALRTIRIAPWIMLLAAIMSAATLFGSLRRFRYFLGGLAVTAVCVEAFAFMLQTRYALVFPTAALHGAMIGIGAGVSLHELGLRKWLFLLARIDRINSQRVLTQVFNDSSDGILVVGEDGVVLELNRYARRLFDADERFDVGSDLAQVVPRQLSQAAKAAISLLRNAEWRDSGPRELTVPVEGDTRHIEYVVTPSRLSHIHRRSQRVSDDLIVASITARDVTVRRRQAARLTYMARFDLLTGAQSRRHFLEELVLHIADAPVGARQVVFVFNLHRFRNINATLGRSIGDALLKAVAVRLRECRLGLSASARLGADSFALYSLEELDPVAMKEIADRLVALVSAPFELEGTVVRVGAHLGLSTGGSEASASSLLENAELAVDEARRTEGCSVKVFDPASVVLQKRARRIETALWTAIENDELFLAYQPQIRLSDMRLVGAEALVRWRHPDLGFVGPDEFIAIAEGNGFIGTLGRWVMEQAARDATGWPSEMSVAVNVSPLQLQQGDVVLDARNALKMTGLDPSRLHLEITESVFLDGAATVIETLQDLRMMGVRLALDDFGSGFSSFSYLARLPLDKIKLDRMFVQELERDASNAAIIRSIVMLSRELGLKLVCEGVETKDQSDFLRSLGCDEGQGYFFGRPQPQSDLLAMAS